MGEVESLKAECERLKAVIRRVLYLNGTGTDCQCQGEWCDHCNLRRLLTAALGEDPDAVVEEIERQRGERKALLAERDTLQRDLDAAIEMMSEKEPPRGVLAVVQAAAVQRMAELEAENARLAADLDALRREQDEGEG